MKYVTYFRVSTNKQGVSGLGLEAQRRVVADYLKRVGGEALAEYTDIESGKNNDRLQLQAALRKCRLTGSTLLIAKLDRLSRNTAFLMTLQESNLEFVCVDMPEANHLTIGIMACLAQWESQRISERTKAALKSKKERGGVLGNAQTLKQHRNTDTTKANEARSQKAKARKADMQKTISEFKSEYQLTTHKQIADKLNEAGYTTTTGKAWNRLTVLKVAA